MRNLRNAIELDHWQRHAQPGERAIYHRGHIGADRTINPQVHRKADHAHLLGEIPETIMRKCGHVKEQIAPQRKCRLLQQRDPQEPGCWIYIAERI